uniref:Uncharacterized protein n=1 Tax=Zymomonas mobilis subsp. mobilis str. CP4 = NRRL B-14023 TaxID=627343 RepID=B3GN73_ZYMMB|nr:hypothetical protein [Zymomonas mobilis subsp. mobilis str. CP4 = NRRL B-14023]
MSAVFGKPYQAIWEDSLRKPVQQIVAKMGRFSRVPVPNRKSTVVLSQSEHCSLWQPK